MCREIVQLDSFFFRRTRPPPLSPPPMCSEIVQYKTPFNFFFAGVLFAAGVLGGDGGGDGGSPAKAPAEHSRRRGQCRAQ